MRIVWFGKKKEEEIEYVTRGMTDAEKEMYLPHLQREQREKNSMEQNIDIGKQLESMKKQILSVIEDKEKLWKEKLEAVASEVRTLKVVQTPERIATLQTEVEALKEEHNKVIRFVNWFIKTKMIKESKQALASGLRGDEYKTAYAFYEAMTKAKESDITT